MVDIGRRNYHRTGENVDRRRTMLAPLRVRIHDEELWVDGIGLVSAGEFFDQFLKETSPPFDLTFSSDTNEKSQLCERCQEKEIVNAFGAEYPKISDQGTPVTPLRHATQNIIESSCQLCHMFASLQERELHSKTCHLWAFPCISKAARYGQSHGVVLSVAEGRTEIADHSDSLKQTMYGRRALLVPVYCEKIMT